MENFRSMRVKCPKEGCGKNLPVNDVLISDNGDIRFVFHCECSYTSHLRFLKDKAGKIVLIGDNMVFGLMPSEGGEK